MENADSPPHAVGTALGTADTPMSTVAFSPRGPSLRTRLAVAVALAVALVIGTGAFLLFKSFEGRLAASIEQTAAGAAHALAGELADTQERWDPARVRDRLLATAAFPVVRGVTALRTADPAGGGEALVSTARAAVPETRLARQAAASNRELWAWDGPTVRIAAVPIRANGHVAGAVAVAVSMASLREAETAGRQLMLVVVAVGVPLLLLLVDVFVRRLVHRPVQDVMDAMRRAGTGDLSARATVHRQDEIGAVAAGLNRMLDEMARLHASMREQIDAATEALRARNDELVQSYQRMFGLREQLARAQQTAAAGQTAATLAHQIGTPLNLISGHVQIMEEESADPRHLERLRSVQDQIRKVTGIVRMTLDAVRQPPGPREPIFPASTLRKLAEVARPRLTAAGIDLALDVQDDLPWLMGDSVQLELALLNLINNSLDAMPNGGRITITASRQDGIARIVVADNGPGIPAAILPRLFEPWVTTKPIGRGTGLGLSITRDAVQAHRGTIAVQSEPGRGTTFIIELPGNPGAPAVRDV